MPLPLTPYLEWLVLTVGVALLRSNAVESTVMAPHAFNSSDFCAMKVIVRCFATSKMGLPRQTCGAQNVFDLARQGVGNRNSCMQATKITKWLQTTLIDTDALKREITSDCGAFQHIRNCVEPFRERCLHVFNVFGLSLFLQQWKYICDPVTYSRLEKHILCRREVPDSANAECRQFAPVLGINFENSTVTKNMTDAECTKFKLILGCRSNVLLAECTKEKGNLAAQFLIDFFNIQAESVGSECSVAPEHDPMKLASIYEKYVEDLASMKPAEIAALTSSSSTTSTTTTTAPKTTSSLRKRLLPNSHVKISLPGRNDLDYAFDPLADQELEPDYDAQEGESDSATFLTSSYAVFIFCVVFHILLIEL